MSNKLTKRMIFRCKDGIMSGTAYRSIKDLGDIRATVSQSADGITLELGCALLPFLNLAPIYIPSIKDADPIIDNYVCVCIAMRDAVSPLVFADARKAYHTVISNAIKAQFASFKEQLSQIGK